MERQRVTQLVQEGSAMEEKDGFTTVNIYIFFHSRYYLGEKKETTLY